MKFDIYQTVTDKIVSMLETAGNWEYPWVSRNGLQLNMPENIVTGKKYSGMNVILLWITSSSFGYTSNKWGTYKQWSEQNRQVAKGEKSTMLMYYSPVVKKDKETGEETKYMLVKSFSVFNECQMTDYVKPEEVDKPAPLCEIDMTISNRVISSHKDLSISFESDKACYIPSTDAVCMPSPDSFKSQDGFHSVLFHELAHWTAPRLNRELSFNHSKYAFEELVAELSSAFSMSKVGLSVEPRKDHASYIASWVKGMKEDKKAIFKAASLAAKATEYVLKDYEA